MIHSISNSMQTIILEVGVCTMKRWHYFNMQDKLKRSPEKFICTPSVHSAKKVPKPLQIPALMTPERAGRGFAFFHHRPNENESCTIWNEACQINLHQCQQDYYLSMDLHIALSYYEVCIVLVWPVVGLQPLWFIQYIVFLQQLWLTQQTVVK